MTPKGEIFENHFRKYLTGGTLIHVLWPSLVKIGRREVAEKSSAFTNRKVCMVEQGSSEPYISSPLSQSRPKFSERCRPFTCVCVPKFVWISRDLLELFTKA